MEISIDVLLIDDDEDAFFLTKDLLSDIDGNRFNIKWCPKYDAVKPALNEGSVDVCLVDHYLGAHTGIELIKELVGAGIKIPLILITGRGDREIDLAAMKAGVADYLAKDELTGATLDRSIRYAIQRRKEEEQRLQLENRLVQSQKWEAIGQLAAGLAHEINTPIHYIGSNLAYLSKRISPIMQLLEEFRDLRQAARDSGIQIPGRPELDEEIKKFLSYRENIENGLRDSQDGIRRITDIVRSVQDFAHPSISTEKTLCNLHELIEATVRLARNEWKYVATIKTEFSPEIKEVPLIKGRFEQAILNLLVNAAHAIADRQKTEKIEGIITLSTKKLPGDEIEVRISDNGCGIPPEIINKVYDPFFTTKEPGRGTGQGLTLVHSVICQSHLGSIEIESEVNKGSTFIIVLPMSQESV